MGAVGAEVRSQGGSLGCIQRTAQQGCWPRGSPRPLLVLVSPRDGGGPLARRRNFTFPGLISKPTLLLDGKKIDVTFSR